MRAGEFHFLLATRKEPSFFRQGQSEHIRIVRAHRNFHYLLIFPGVGHIHSFWVQRLEHIVSQVKDTIVLPSPAVFNSEKLSHRARVIHGTTASATGSSLIAQCSYSTNLFTFLAIDMNE